MKLLRTILIAIFVVAGLAYLNIIIPQPQTTSAHTDSYNFADTCGTHDLSAQMSSETCADFYHAGNDYSSNITITNTSGHTLNGVVLHAKTFYCENQGELSSGNPAAGINPGSCLQREKDFQTPSVNLAAGQTYTFPNAPVRSASEYGQNMCGLYQYDFWFSYNGSNGKSCTSTYNNKDFGFAGDSYCKLWDGHTLASSNPWSPQWQCGQTHKTCQNNACVTVNGSGTSTCTGDSDCQPQQHLACQNYACVMVDGAGDAQCTTTPNSCAQTHKACQDNACKIISGPGEDTCSTDTQCQQQTHKSCSNNACVIVQGGGADSCSTDNDCKQETHKACVSNACTVVVGGGSDSCGQDSDCKTPTHRACVSQACTIVLGSGSDSCSQDSDCHVDTCSGTNCGNININVNQSQNQQQQQQQAVLGASVAPAATTTSLPSTGSGAEVLLSLLGLLPIGFKLRKLV